MKTKKSKSQQKIEGIPKSFVLPENIISTLKAVSENQKKLTKAFEPFRKPLEERVNFINSTLQNIKPQLETLNDIYKQEEYFIPIPAKTVDEVRVVNIEDINIRSSRGKNDTVIASYNLPQNAVWESLDIKFLDGHFVKVSYPCMKSKKFDFKDMGFANMKTVNADRKWELLKAIAENGGALNNSKWNRNFGRNVKYELNKKLKLFFGMEINPISNYTKKDGYKALFSLRDVG